MLFLVFHCSCMHLFEYVSTHFFLQAVYRKWDRGFCISALWHDANYLVVKTATWLLTFSIVNSDPSYFCQYIQRAHVSAALPHRRGDCFSLFFFQHEMLIFACGRNCRTNVWVKCSKTFQRKVTKRSMEPSKFPTLSKHCFGAFCGLPGETFQEHSRKLFTKMEHKIFGRC